MDTLNCVSSCTGNLGAKFKTSGDLEKCLYPFESCLLVGEFADSTTNYLCTLCSSVLTNCVKCTDSKVCTECSGGAKLVYESATSVYCKAVCESPFKLDNTDGNCISNCSTNTSPYIIENSAGIACVNSCGDGNYFFL